MIPNFKNIFLFIVILYLLFAVYAYFFTDAVIYAPRVSSYKDSSEIIKLRTKDGALISAIYLPNPQATYTFLISHGNAENIEYVLPFIKMFNQHGFSVFTYDYHGYGTSTGKPTEKNVYNDIDAAYDYLTQNLKIPPSKIIVFGHSIGAAVNIELALHKKIAGLILQGAFLTAERIVTQAQIFPFAKYNNLKKISGISVPILFIHGTNDEVIPFWHGKKLYDRATTLNKQYLWVPGAHHNDLPEIAGDTYWQAIYKFTNGLKK